MFFHKVDFHTEGHGNIKQYDGFRYSPSVELLQVCSSKDVMSY